MFTTVNRDIKETIIIVIMIILIIDYLLDLLFDMSIHVYSKQMGGLSNFYLLLVYL